MTFDGETATKADEGRLWTQLTATKDLMSDGRWRTLYEIRLQLSAHYGCPASEAGISARLRDLRKAKHGAYQVERNRCGAMWEYRVLDPLPTGQLEML